MERKLQTFIQRAIGLADVRNLSPDNPITLTIEAPNSSLKTLIVVAVNEPWQYPLPVNVTWINFNPRSPYFKRALKRVSKDQQSPNSPFQHTWGLLTKYLDIFEPPQYYDSDTGATDDVLTQHINNKGNPHETTALHVGALPLTGGTMTGPIIARTLDIAEEYGSTELIPKQFVDNLAVSINNNIQSIERRIGSSGNVSTHKHTEDSAKLTWEVTHNLGTRDLIYQVYGDDGASVLPSSVEFVSDNHMRFKYAVEEAGKVLLVAAIDATP